MLVTTPLRHHRNALTALIISALIAVTVPVLVATTSAAAPTTSRAVTSGVWSDPAVWGGAVPGAGQNVLIPRGVRVRLDRTSTSVGVLQVDGVLSLATIRLTLAAKAILVRGALKAGTETTPFRHRARIVLTGTDTGESLMGVGNKVLAAVGGVIDLHGRPFTSWTRLGANAALGANTLRLAGPTNWEPGNRIVVASTDYDPEQAEQFTITAVAEQGSLLTLDRPLSYPHWGTTQTLGGRVLDERAEVGLLGRSISIEGAVADSANGYGGQVSATNGGALRLSNVALTRVGQAGKLGRTPVNFSLLGNTPTVRGSSYIRDSSIWNSTNRCVSVQGTNAITVENNLCYDHVGHGYYLADGSETNNRIINNLGLSTRGPQPGQELLPSDSEDPCTFWITNPNNVVKGNVAAGSTGMGIRLAFPEHPIGPSADATVWPRRTPLGLFAGNKAHSNSHGIFADFGPKADGTTEVSVYDPRSNPSDPNSTPVSAVFSKLTSYKNRVTSAWLRGSWIRVEQSMFADSAQGATLAGNNSKVIDSVFVGESANPGFYTGQGAQRLDGGTLPDPYNPSYPIRGYQFMDGRVAVINSTFVNFTPTSQRQASAVAPMVNNEFTTSPQNYAAGLRFVNANRVWFASPSATQDNSQAEMFFDRDGSITGTAGAAITSDTAFLAAGSCTVHADWNAQVCDLPPGTGAGRARIYLLDGSTTGQRPITVTRQANAASLTLDGTWAGDNAVNAPIYTGQRYGVSFGGGAQPPSRALYVLYNTPGQWVQYDISSPSAPTSILLWDCDIKDPGSYCYDGDPTSQADLSQASGTASYYDPASHILHLRVFSPADWTQVQVDS